MIVKARSRGGGRQFGLYLLNLQNNEQAEVMDLRGSIAQDAPGALHEWEIQARATNATQHLYHEMIMPWADNYTLTRDQYFELIDRLERALGLDNQPRLVVRHVPLKDGREHYHVIYSRTIPEQGRAVQLSHDAWIRIRVARE